MQKPTEVQLHLVARERRDLQVLWEDELEARYIAQLVECAWWSPDLAYHACDIQPSADLTVYDVHAVTARELTDDEQGELDTFLTMALLYDRCEPASVYMRYLEGLPGVSVHTVQLPDDLLEDAETPEEIAQAIREHLEEKMRANPPFPPASPLATVAHYEAWLRHHHAEGLTDMAVRRHLLALTGQSGRASDAERALPEIGEYQQQTFQ